MRVLKVLVVVPLWFLLTAQAPPASPSSTASPTPTPSSIPSPAPAPTPTPVYAFITLDVSAGGPNTRITVSGNSFNPGEPLSIDWDGDTTKVLGSTTANAQGNFSGVTVRPYAQAAPGLHHICASVNPFPCAQFQLQGTPTPTPPAPKTSTSPSPSPSPSLSPTPSIIPIPAGSDSGLDVMLHPPFVFLPIITLLAVIAAAGYWLFGKLPRPQKNLPAASIVHRSARPIYGAHLAAQPPPAPSPSAQTPERAPAPPEEPPRPGPQED
jgi:hypothetical protein